VEVIFPVLSGDGLSSGGGGADLEVTPQGGGHIWLQLLDCVGAEGVTGHLLDCVGGGGHRP
jgi:hypothetical protein